MLESESVRVTGVQEILGVKILSRTGQVIAFFAHAWRDKRVPLIARILLLIIPLYILAPFDLLPDHLPGGFLDDLLVLACLVTLARCIVPRGVFIDARKAAAFGIVLFSVATYVQDKGELLSLSSTAATVRSEKVISHPDGARSLFDLSGARHCRTQALPRLQEKSAAARQSAYSEFDSLVCRQCLRTEQAAQIPRKCRALLMKGGEDQLYGISGQLTCFLGNSFQCLLLPPCPTGGIFCLSGIKTGRVEAC